MSSLSSDRVVDQQQLRLRPSSRTAGLVQADARRDLVTPGVAWAVALAPIIGALLLGVVFVLDRPNFYLVLREDYPVEWAQFSLCAFSCLVAGATALRLLATRQYGVALLLVLVALTCLGLAGEEISWGQRVFNLAEPSSLAGVNAQAELNVHNVEAGGIRIDDIFKVFSFLIGFTGVALALLTRGRRPVLSGKFWWQVSPPLFTVVGFASMALYRPFTLFEPAVVANPAAIFQEWVEFSLYLALAATLVCIYRRAAPDAETVDVSDGSRAWALATAPTRSRYLVAAALLVVVVTIVFAALTVHYGIVPGNVSGPPS